MNNINDFIIEDGELKKYVGSDSTVVIPDSVTQIGWRAFEDCYELTSIIIPNNVKAIRSSAFTYCAKLANITIPDSVTEIGKEAFLFTAYYENKDNWEKGVLYIGNHLIKAERVVGDYAIKPGTKTIAAGAFNIDNYVEYFAKEEFDEECVSLNAELKSVTIPDSIQQIDMYTFKNCYNLTQINIPNSVTEICSGAFENCKDLQTITIPNSVTKIGSHAFEGCTGLTNIIIPDGVTKIEHDIFKDCKNLKSITIPNSVTNIYSAFEGCVSLAEITIPEKVTEIDQHAFVGCKSLANITISENIKSISYSAFKDCCIQKLVIKNKNIDYCADSFKNAKIESVELPEGFFQTKKTLPAEFSTFVSCENTMDLAYLWMNQSIKGWKEWFAKQSFNADEVLKAMVDLILQGKKISAKQVKLAQEFVTAYSNKLSAGLGEQMLGKIT